ncbi:MAG: CoA-binding protein [Gammaproteobacteria bacterium]
MRTIAQILNESKTVAVVGLSPKPERPAGHVAEYLQQQGYRILPVNPAYAGGQLLGEPVHATLREASESLGVGDTIDIVDCFRNSDDMPDVARDAIEVRAKCLWMQLGVINQSAADLATAAGLDVVMDHCMLIEHSALREDA